MARLRYVVCDTLDPEERLEDAALWKALHDHYGADIEAVKGRPDDGVPWFGRGNRFTRNAGQVGSHHLPYWTDRAFLVNCRRRFTVAPLERVGGEVERLHAIGLGAFLKSTREKHCIIRVPVGSDWESEVGAMAYSFIDGGPDLMVQELVEITEEYRFFVIGRQVITYSLNKPELTPIASTPAPPAGYLTLAAKVATEMATPNAVVDLGRINGVIGVVEFNPMVLGGVGLFACDVSALARASERMLADGALSRHDPSFAKHSGPNTLPPDTPENP